MSIAFPTINYARMNKSARNTKDWITAVAKYMNLSPSALGANAGVAPSTITRYLNDGSGTIGISKRTLEQLEDYSGIQLHAMPNARSGFSEADALPIEPHNQKASTVAAIAALTDGRNSVVPFEMKGWALDQVGVLPGDTIIIDMNLRPRKGDIVCAQVADWQTGQAETVMRVFEPPFIMAASSKLGIQKPLVVDEDRISVRGVMIANLRIRH